MPYLSAIILSNTIDEDIYNINCQCFDSLIKSEEWNNNLEIILIESNINCNKSYPFPFIRTIKPDQTFNYHRFLNIGVQVSKGDFLAFCNNDIIFHKGWFSKIIKVKEANPEFNCFSPLDRNYPLMSKESLPEDKPFYIGWKNKKHFAAWCFVWERKVFNTIGEFDETFNFYSADDDELQTLHYFAIPNVLVTASEVSHLSQVVTNKCNAIHSPVIPQNEREKYPLTEEEIKRGYTWLWDDIKFYEAYQKEKKKWGDKKMRARIDRFFERHPRYNIRPITQFLYNKKVNLLLCKISGIKL